MPPGSRPKTSPVGEAIRRGNISARAATAHTESNGTRSYVRLTVDDWTTVAGEVQALRAKLADAWTLAHRLGSQLVNLAEWGALVSPRRCPDCHVTPGQLHDDGCDVARCWTCRSQRLMCAGGHEPTVDVWTGTWPSGADGGSWTAVGMEPLTSDDLYGISARFSAGTWTAADVAALFAGIRRLTEANANLIHNAEVPDAVDLASRFAQLAADEARRLQPHSPAGAAALKDFAALLEAEAAEADGGTG